MADKEVQLKNTGKKTTKVSQSEITPVTTTTSSSSLSSLLISSDKAATSGSSGKQPTKQLPTKESGVTKEVLLILKEMNANLNAQATRLEKQEQKLQSFTEQIADQEYGDFNDYNDYECQEQYDDDACMSEQASILSSTKKTTGGGIFSSLVNKFQQEDAVDSEVNDDLAHFVNMSFRSGLTEDKLSDIVKDIHRPQNCEALVKTRVNQGIWRLLKMHTQADDNRMQVIQDLIIKATSNLVKLIDKNADSLDPCDMDWSSNSIALLGQANKLINIRRKELHKSDLDPKYHYLASASLPFTDHLYGDDTDVNKNVKEINDLNKIGRNLGRGFPRGNYRGYVSRRPHPYYRRGFRGRGRGRPDISAASKNVRMAPKK
jgi:hypothetical protein